MAITAPYKRIFRPMLNGSDEEYVGDPLYAPDMYSFVHSYHLIEKDLKVLFDYISPNTSNNGVFSHRIYELFFRACTEFENSATSILRENGYPAPAPGCYWNIKNYFNVNKAMALDRYEVRIGLWENAPLILKPFSCWNTTSYNPLKWYKDYNSVKHDRTQNFHLASLENLLNSSAGLLIILYAQFGPQAFNPYQSLSVYNSKGPFESVIDSLFEINPPIWTDAEKYEFDWATIKINPNPCQNFVF